MWEVLDRKGQWWGQSETCLPAGHHPENVLTWQQDEREGGVMVYGRACVEEGEAAG